MVDGFFVIPQRVPVIFKAKNAFLKWLAEVCDDNAECDILAETGSEVYLLPALARGQTLEDYFKINWEYYWQHLLSSCFIDQEIMPRDANYELFSSWFEIIELRMVFDTVDEPIVKDNGIIYPVNLNDRFEVAQAIHRGNGVGRDDIDNIQRLIDSEFQLSGDDNLTRAKELIYDAVSSTSKHDRVAKANKALELWPDCADAYLILAKDASVTVRQKKVLCKQAVDAAERALGGAEKISKYKNYGRFFERLSTRSYIRAKIELAHCFVDVEAHDKAIDTLNDVLNFQPEDRENTRYFLASLLAKTKKFDELNKLVNKGAYSTECSTYWIFTRLLLFLVKGDEKNAVALKRSALNRNPHVPVFLLHANLPAPKTRIFEEGSEEEAYAYAYDFKDVWDNLDCSVAWLANAPV